MFFVRNLFKKMFNIIFNLDEQEKYTEKDYEKVKYYVFTTGTI